MYNVGDCVYVKDNADKIHCPTVGFADEMKQYTGNEYYIKEVKKNHAGTTVYTLHEVKYPYKKINGDGYWMWTEDWLMPGGKKIEIENDEIMKLFS